MNRRMFLTLSLMAGLTGQAAFAKSFAESVVDQLRAQGFESITVERTFLGRTRIVARSAEGAREIIVNPRTGEILRDLWIAASGKGSGGGLIEDSDSGKGRGRGGDDDDDDDDDDDGSDDSSSDHSEKGDDDDSDDDSDNDSDGGGDDD